MLYEKHFSRQLIPNISIGENNVKEKEKAVYLSLLSGDIYVEQHILEFFMEFNQEINNSNIFHNQHNLRMQCMLKQRRLHLVRLLQTESHTLWTNKVDQC